MGLALLVLIAIALMIWEGILAICMINVIAIVFIASNIKKELHNENSLPDVKKVRKNVLKLVIVAAITLLILVSATVITCITFGDIFDSLPRY